jgi:hypothetical protein
MTALQLLRLSSNSFSGSISSSISNMTSLVKISMGVNQFTGSIPTEIASLTKLYFLGAFTNPLTGKPYKMWFIYVINIIRILLFINADDIYNLIKLCICPVSISSLL